MPGPDTGKTQAPKIRLIRGQAHAAPGRPWKRPGARSLAAIGAVLLAIAIGWIYRSCRAEEKPPRERPRALISPIKPTKDTATVIRSDARYLVSLGDFQIRTGLRRREERFEDIFRQYGVSSEIGKLVLPAILQEVDTSRPDGRYKVLLTKDRNSFPRYFIYEDDPYSYLLVGLNPDSTFVSRVKRNVTQKRRAAGLLIEDNLREDLLKKGLRYELIAEIEKAMAWTVDLFHLARGDLIKMVFDEKYAGNECVGIGKLYAIEIVSGGVSYFGYDFDNGKTEDYFSENARSMKKSFLMAPVKYAIISSPYSLARVHPVTGELKPHFGTDYAAPEGTPIQSVGDGVVIEAAFKENNGNYVKIRHDRTYTSQYLHMRNFADGIRKGAVVRQGQTIGFVGQTGLATGPHVCFRFWKNEVQIDHRAEKFPSPSSIPGQFLGSFKVIRDSMDLLLSGINDY